MDKLFNDMLSKNLIDVCRFKDGDLFLATLKELAERRNKLGRLMMAFVQVKLYVPDWLYWVEFNKVHNC